MEDSLFIKKVIDAICDIEIDSSKKNKDRIVNLFKNKFDSNQATFYEMFQIGADGTSILSLEQQRILFDSLERVDTNPKAHLFGRILRILRR